MLEEMTKHRRYLHTIPEVYFQEHLTTDYITNELTKMGYRPLKYLETGAVCFKKGSTGNKTIGFRADIDGLPVMEENNIDFKSQNGNMHACGHDGHISILLGLAKYLSAIETKENVLFIFQPAEEFEGGAKKLIEKGLFKDYPCDAIFALHIMPSIEEHSIALKAGALMAMNADIDIEIIGKAAHGALPQNALDSIYASSQLISQYQSILSRSLSPMDQSLISLTTIEGGKAKNIICDQVKIGGTIRTFSEKSFSKILERITEINHGIENAFGVKVNCRFAPRYKAVINDETLVGLLKSRLNKFHVVEAEATMVVEDFSFYLESTPGVMMFLGSKNIEKDFVHPLHSNKFNFDESILETGLAYYKSVLEMMDVL
ncbi:M20 metallopeptidase family protein [Clostridium formicaceticum]|uniref:N-acetyldiaminopimelate deacetylase n=1 Tax=Clostridium formicaceticum TaxID=1497 RepID=A0AAC9RKD5_9CLOT|nr:M20 family metallopeptidase [Clostridium formicaceticum]AOY76562.1 hypothetical protein BJL90_12255 [Clostridium formicaceticum]ARE86980.1 N-acetyldiaminopimelate deacetylase [Clostridium formicaceticum]